MKKYDVWLYAVCIQAEDANHAQVIVNEALDHATKLCTDSRYKEILSQMQVDYAEGFDLDE